MSRGIFYWLEVIGPQRDDLSSYLRELIFDHLDFYHLEQLALVKKSYFLQGQRYLKRKIFKVNHLQVSLRLSPHLYQEEVSESSEITWEFVRDHPELPWNYSYLSLNQNITWEIVQDHPEREWDYTFLSGNQHITWEIVSANLTKMWGSLLSRNPNITWKIVESNPWYPWSYYHLSKNPSITWEDILHHPDRPWDYDQLTTHPKITLAIMESYPELPWNYSKLRNLMISTQRELSDG